MFASLELPPGNFPASLFASPDRHLFSHSRYLHFSLPTLAEPWAPQCFVLLRNPGCTHTQGRYKLAQGAFLFHKCCVPGGRAAWRAGQSEPAGEPCNRFLLTSCQVTHLSQSCPAPQPLNCLKQHLKGTSSKLFLCSAFHVSFDTRPRHSLCETVSQSGWRGSPSAKKNKQCCDTTGDTGGDNTKIFQRCSLPS